MDVLRKELQEVFGRQHFTSDSLLQQDVEDGRMVIKAFTAVSQGCTILTDMGTNSSYFSIGRLEEALGLKDEVPTEELIDADEDFIYRRIHPEDLVDKRMLELKYFEQVEAINPEERLKYHALCRIRMRNAEGAYIYINNLTKILCNTPNGSMRLVICTYEISPNQEPIRGINPRIVNNATGEVRQLSLYEERYTILSKREKEILQLISKGALSKEIADRLHISIHTVNTHRQNILQKLSVDNSMEAVQTAMAMRLI